MVNLTIDGKKISVEENTTIMEAAASNGIPIPKLCYLKGINEIAACRVCVVELEGKEIDYGDQVYGTVLTTDTVRYARIL